MSSGLPLARVAAIAPAADSLRGRVILVTGAAGGLGSAAVFACARAGATVVLAGRKVRPLEKLYDEIEAAGAVQPALYPINLEGATPQNYADLADAMARECGRLDGIVHAAAHFDSLQPLEQLKAEEWLRALQVNVTAPFLMTQACLPLLRAAPDAAVVFVLDDPDRMGKAYWNGYGVAKTALHALVSILHEETESSRVRVHALLPGPMRTKLRQAAWFGEDPLARPPPGATGEAAAFLLGPGAADLRGRTLDLRPL